MPYVNGKHVINHEFIFNNKEIELLRKVLVEVDLEVDKSMLYRIGYVNKSNELESILEKFF